MVRGLFLGIYMENQPTSIVMPELAPIDFGNEFYIIDTETASLKGGIVEYAHLKIDNDLNVLEECCLRLNPERPIDPGASAVHGITDEDVANCPTASEALPKFGKPINFIAHNAKFDKRMLAAYIDVAYTFCSLAASRKHIKHTTNHKLETLQRELNFPEQKSHSALGDVYTVRDLLQYLCSTTGATLQELFMRAQTARIVHFMPFGKYKGQPILRVPRDYREWLLNQGDLDEDLTFTLQRLKDI